MSMLIECEWCSKVFNRKPSHVFGHIFCSHKCYGNWFSSYAKGKINPSWKGGKITKVCKVCGKPFEVFPCRNNAYFCSNSCRGLGVGQEKRGNHLSKETKKSLSRKAKKRWRKLSFRKKMSKILTGRKFSDEAKKKMASLWRNEEYVQHVLEGLHRKPTEPEQKMIAICRDFSLPFRYCGDGSFMIDVLNPDFVHTNGEKKVIEVFGRVFHDPDASFFEVSWHRQYWGRMAYYTQFGYDCLIVWDDELGDEVGVIEKIKAFVF